MSLKPSVYFTPKAHLDSDRPHFHCSLATSGYWLPYWTAQLYKHFKASKLRLNIRGTLRGKKTNIQETNRGLLAVIQVLGILTEHQIYLMSTSQIPFTLYPHSPIFLTKITLVKGPLKF